MSVDLNDTRNPRRKLEEQTEGDSLVVNDEKTNSLSPAGIRRFSLPTLGVRWHAAGHPRQEDRPLLGRIAS